MRAFPLSIAIVIGISLLNSDLALPEEGKRGIEIISPKAEKAEKPLSLQALYVKKYAVVVGINQYPNIAKLSAAVNDAKKVAAKLTAMGFNEVITLLDGKATKASIVEALGDQIGEKAQENDLIVFFFAGHGETKGNETEQMGFILPYDYNPKRHMTTSISMSTLHDISKGIKAKHMLYAMDSCFSGGILKSRGATAFPAQASRGTYRYLKNLTESQAHVVLAAGGQNEYAVENGGSGIFTRAFLDGLSGKGEFAQKGYVTASALGAYIQERVQQDLPPGVKQNPQYGRLLGEGDVVLAMFRPIQNDPQEQGAQGAGTDRAPEEGGLSEEMLKKERERMQREMKEFEERVTRVIAEQERQASVERERIRQEEQRMKKMLEERERDIASEREKLREEDANIKKVLTEREKRLKEAEQAQKELEERERQAALEREKLRQEEEKLKKEKAEKGQQTTVEQEKKRPEEVERLKKAVEERERQVAAEREKIRQQEEQLKQERAEREKKLQEAERLKKETAERERQVAMERERIRQEEERVKKEKSEQARQAALDKMAIQRDIEQNAEIARKAGRFSFVAPAF